MSKFLAPIHFWLFNKIKIHEDLEKAVVSKFSDKYGESVLDIEKQNIDKYGARVPDVSLEEIIDEGNIHGWLQNKISIAETRQAAILGDLFKSFGNEGVEIAKEVYIEDARLHGSKAHDTVDISTADDIFRTINNYMLDGMPCDSVNNITKSEADIMEFEKIGCLHVEYWNRADVDSNLMYDLREAWIGAFVSTLAPSFKYQVDGNVHKILKV